MLSDSFIFDMVHTLPYASFKDASTGKYILANHEIAGCWNLSPEQMVGLTVGDLGPGTSIADLGLVKSRLRKAHAVQTQEMDRWVREQRSGTTTTRIVLRLDNENLTYESVAKLPILGKKNLLGIVTYGSNLTPGLSLRSLFFLYERMFPKKNAIERFLRHVGIDSYFFVALTRSEVLVLIERSHAKSNMEIAAQHKVIVRTVETHMANVRLKLKGDVLPTVLAQLRGRNEVKVDDLIGIESDRNDRMPSLPIDAKVRARKPDR